MDRLVIADDNRLGTFLKELLDRCDAIEGPENFFIAAAHGGPLSIIFQRERVLAGIRIALSQMKYIAAILGVFFEGLF